MDADAVSRRLGVKVPFRECATGAGSQVALEPLREHFIGQSEVRGHFPRLIFIGVNGLSRIMLCEASSEIFGATNICSLGLVDASKDVNVKHGARLRLPD